jgi:methionyl-tRNA formyltransferase
MSFVLFAAFNVGAEVSKIVRTHGELPALVVTCATDPNEAQIADAWSASGVPVLRGVGVNSAACRERLEFIAPAFCVLAWWPEIVRTPVLEIPRAGWINMHPSLLPWGKGKHGYYWSIVHAEPFGVTLHLIDAGIDSGHVLVQQQLQVDWTDTGESLYTRSRDAIVALFTESWPTLCNGELTVTAQPVDTGSYHWGREIASHSQIVLDRQYSGRELLNILRGRTFWSGDSAWFEDGGQRYRARLQIERVGE